MKKKPFDRYLEYRRAVQSPEVDCQFVSDTYKELKGRRPRILREDFCGTYALCCQWVRRNKGHRAYGIDLDNEPLQYGHEHNLIGLKAEQRSRLQTIQGSVLTAKVPLADVEIALNFSYYIFKSRMVLRRYFKRALLGLRRDGIFIVDSFGGSECQGANTEHHNIGNLIYYWEQASYDPATNGAVFNIHFKRKGEKKRENVFSYDWRMWTIPEIRETMLEAGFRRTHIYWEGTTRAGDGDGDFKRVDKGEECEAWVAYVVGEK